MIMPERERIIDVYDRRAFRTIYEAINWCVGTDYRYWGRACWPSGKPSDGFRMWFTQLADVERGRYVPAVNQCLNLICSDGNYHVFDDYRNQQPDEMWKRTWKYDLIFSKETGGSYFFRGAFVEDKVHSSLNHYVSKRVATKVKLIGCPARRLELINLVRDDVEFDENYLKKHIVSSDVIHTGPSVLTPSERNEKSEKVSNNMLKKSVQEPIVDYAKMFPKGCRIDHISFGVGTVETVSDGIITAKFKGIGIKLLGAEACVKMNLIKRI